MKILGFVLCASLALYGCGQKASEKSNTETTNPVKKTQAEMPKDSVHGQMPENMAAGHQKMDVNTEINLKPEIAAAWAGGIVEVKTKDGQAQRYTLKIGEATPLGDTGLTATALSFIPDFVMDETGITSRSAEAKNPALEVLIQEEGKPDYKGWLFARMPNIHPFPHDTYSVILVDGVPAAD